MSSIKLNTFQRPLLTDIFLMLIALVFCLIDIFVLRLDERLGKPGSIGAPNPARQARLCASITMMSLAGQYHISSSMVGALKKQRCAFRRSFTELNS
jgi:hypothetical protein